MPCDAAPCGLLSTDSKGVLLGVNRTFCDWIGRSPEELVGRCRLQDLFTMGGRIFYQTHCAPLLGLQGSISEVKLEAQHADGHAIPMVINAIRHARDGMVVDDIAIFVARDRDKYERELLLSRRRLEALVLEEARLRAEAKDQALFAEQMIGIVSHDLRNPLAAIDMAVRALALRDPSGTRLQVGLDRITRSTDRATRLIGDLLDFTLARTGKGLTVTQRPIDLDAVVGDTVEELALAFPERPLRHVHAGSGSCPADPDRLQQLIGNLVANAMTYGRAGTDVTVRSSVTDASFTVAVHNHGDPLPPALRDSLFQPMVRGASAGASRSVGLGLFIVSEIVRAHGGEVSVESDETAGTTFLAVFPRSHA